MIYLALPLFGVLFLELFLLLGVVKTGKSIASVTRESLRVLGSSDYDDDAKERYARRSSLVLFRCTGMIVLKFVAIATGLCALYLLLVTVDPELRDRLLASFTSLRLIALMTIGAAAYAWVRNAVIKQLQPG